MNVSLLTFLDTPVLVGDPDGRAAYVNPAFERAFAVAAEAARGAPLATLFEGGARETVLAAVARACQEGRSVRFRLRVGAEAWTALLSPIEAQHARVGVILLLLAAPVREERLLALHRDIQEPLSDLARRLDELLEQTGGRRAERYRGLVEDGLRGLERIRKWSAEVEGLLSGAAEGPEESWLDPVRVVRASARRVAEELRAAGIEFEALVPARLPRVRGEEARLERALVALLRDRLERDPAPASVTLAAKRVAHGPAPSVVISVVDAGSGDGHSMDDPTEPEPAGLRELVSGMGGELSTTVDPVAGRSTSIRLRATSD